MAMTLKSDTNSHILLNAQLNKSFSISPKPDDGLLHGTSGSGRVYLNSLGNQTKIWAADFGHLLGEH